MSRATQEATIERSYADSEHKDLESQVTELHERLLVVMKEEAEIRASLNTLFDQEETKVMEEYYKAKQNITLFRAKREKISRDTKRKQDLSLVGTNCA